MKLFWWLRHDRIGRSRLFLLGLLVVALVGWAVFGWPTREQVLVAAGLLLLLVVGDYLFWRSDVRHGRASGPE